MSSLSFSYAQAAKGLAPSSNVSSNPVSSASSEHGSKDTSLNIESSVTQSKPSRSEKSEKEADTLPRSTRSSLNQIDGDSTLQSEKSPPQTTESIVDDSKSTRSQQSFTDDFISPSKAPESPSGPVVSNIEEQEDTRNDSPQMSDAQDKTKEADDDWEKVSIPSSAADKELKAAPIPVVNVWQQRQAKLKEQSIQRPSASTQSQAKSQSPSTRATTSTDDSKKKSGSRESTNADTSRTSPGRVVSGGRLPRDQRGNSTSPRSTSQQKEQPATRPPPRADAASWPTPENAIVDAGRRSSLLDRADKGELADAKPSNRKNQWTTMPFVPSVKFETQMPSSRRGGGRTGNTRGGGRGATNTQGERNSERAEPGSMGPPALPKPAGEQDRGRKGNNARSNRASSVPSEAPHTESANERQHALEAVPVKESGTTSSQSQVPASDEVVSGLEALSLKEASRSSSRQAPTASVTTSRQKSEAEHSSTQYAEVIESPSKQSHRPEKHSNNSFENSRSTNEGNEKASKERSNKTDSWRADQRGDRSDRGRGSYRGRTNRASYNNPSFTTPLPQNGFEANKHSASDARPNRQPSQSYGTPPFGSNRNPGRAHSIPVGILPGNFFSPPQNFPQPLAPIQTDLNYNAYGQMPNGMPNGIMSAMPYNEPLSGYALISMVSRQLEYYFSLDNLCKDMFLRKNMDSQGFVLLRVIADFRRIKTLLGEGSMSYEHLRQVATNVTNTEYVVGEDGEDRLRSRGNWKDFVLPTEERVAHAQNEGPQIPSYQIRHSVSLPPEFHMGNGLRSAPPNMNGFQDAFTNHHTPVRFSHGLVDESQTTEQWSGRVDDPQNEERQASVASPLGKIQSPSQEPKAMYAVMTNGHRDSMSSNTPGKENTFSDENVALLKVVVRDPDHQTQEEGSTEEESVPDRSSGLRGGAGSPEQFERIRGLQFDQNTAALKKSGEQAMYFTQGEGSRLELMKPGYIHEDYLVLRDQAYNQRAENHFGGALLVLYPLWADFLAVPHQFNVGMYEEFKTWALEDEERGNDNGKKYLAKFYDAMLGGNNAMTERISNDIINVARTESGSNRQVWLKLRGAWRNGATNLKTRKRLADLLTVDEREELDRNS